jgi:hypothetical protein
MSEKWEPPQWLEEALVKYRAEMSKYPGPVEVPEIVPGDIRMCHGIDGKAALVLVHSHIKNTHEYIHTGTLERTEVPCFDFVQVTMLSNEVDVASDYTPILTPTMTGLPYKLVETTLIGQVFPHQLSTLRYGRINNKLRRALWRIIWHDPTGFRMRKDLKRGMPLSGREDWRWKAQEDWLTEEYDYLIGWCMAASMADLDGDPHPDDCPCSVCRPR